MVRRGASPKGGNRDNKKIRWPKIMTDKQQSIWYAKVDMIRQRSFLRLPRQRLFLPEPRKLEKVF